MNRISKLWIYALIAFSAVLSAETEEKKNKMIFSKSESIHKGEFGSCCKELKTCMNQPNSLIFKNEEGNLFMSVGYMSTEKGVAWFDHIIIYCPFCGVKIQDRKTIAKPEKETD